MGTNLENNIWWLDFQGSVKMMIQEIRLVTLPPPRKRTNDLLENSNHECVDVFPTISY